MKLRCIKNKTEWIEYAGITPGKIYEIEDAYVGSYSTYYIKDDDKQYKYLDNVFNAHILEKYYNSNGLVYLIYVFKNFEDGKIQYDILDEIYNKIKSRCHKVTIKDSKYCLCVSNSQVQ